MIVRNGSGRIRRDATAVGWAKHRLWLTCHIRPRCRLANDLSLVMLHAWSTSRWPQRPRGPLLSRRTVRRSAVTIWGAEYSHATLRCRRNRCGFGSCGIIGHNPPRRGHQNSRLLKISLSPSRKSLHLHTCAPTQAVCLASLDACQCCHSSPTLTDASWCGTYCCSTTNGSTAAARAQIARPSSTAVRSGGWQ